MQIFLRPSYGAALVAVPIESSDTVDDVFRKFAQIADIKADSSHMRLSHHGRPLHRSSHIITADNSNSIQNNSIVDLLPCHGLRGGGGDGGSTGTESRSAYLEMYANKKPDKVNPEEERLARWTACHLSGMPLQAPLVCDDLGNLYNKDALLHALVTKTIPKSLSHITSIKHVFDVTLTPRSDVAENDMVRFACPVTEQQFNGKSRFVVIKTVDKTNGKVRGHVVSEKAIKELSQVVKEVIGRHDYSKDDIMLLYPQGEELEHATSLVLAKRSAKKESKKSKKSAKNSASNHGSSVKRTAGGVGRTGENDNDDNVDETTTVEESSAQVSKKAKSVVEKLMPADATPEVWQSLFVKKEGKGEKKGNNNDYMVRGGLKYVV